MDGQVKWVEEGVSFEGARAGSEEASWVGPSEEERPAAFSRGRAVSL